MKYTKEITEELIAEYAAGKTPEELATLLDVPPRSIIAKLSSLGVYQRKTYRTKRGEIPVKKEEYIERIAQALNTNSESLESLEKVNKSVLELLHRALAKP
jgi:predicted house-cleaning noncanonical NTP pyrophosphatase (MazG superfamily)